ncbi:MAG: exosortase-associated EpsI family protein [Phycisphaerae bacterium]|nr:exosortase-associated EpsI family protein [Phycisphaerae bacterium]
MNWRQVVSPAFVVAAAVLLAALLGLVGLVWASDWVLVKRSLPLRRHLYLFPDQLGPYRKSGEQKLSRELVEELGTTRYLLRFYEASGSSSASLQLHLAYYTGSPDSAPHVSDRLYVVGGERGVFQETDRLSLGTDKLPLALFRYQPPEAANSVFVARCFIANGRNFSDPQKVQEEIAAMRNRHAYWCRLEIELPGAKNLQEAKDQARRFLVLALPEIRGMLPAWRSPQAGPAQEGNS